jgi:predicted  nucleic acid-binding Zn-ribbon protein
MKDLDKLKDDNQDLKRKLEGAKCRIRNLECDATTIRQKMQTLVEKSNHDDLLVNEQRVRCFSTLRPNNIYIFHELI